MINNFETEQDFLNYLMTSEFLDDELTPSELRELLFKFRYFYRTSHAKQKSMDHRVRVLKDKIEILEKQINSSKEELDKKDIKYSRVVDRDLTAKERLFGKIFEREYDRRFHLFKK